MPFAVERFFCHNGLVADRCVDDKCVVFPPFLPNKVSVLHLQPQPFHSPGRGPPLPPKLPIQARVLPHAQDVHHGSLAVSLVADLLVRFDGAPISSSPDSPTPWLKFFS